MSDLAIRDNGGQLEALGVHVQTSNDGRYRAIVLDPEVRERCNVLLPVQEIAQAVEMYTPSLRAVQLDPSPDGPHFYKQGQRLALRKQALETLADLAGVTSVSTRPLTGEELESHHQRDADGKTTMRAAGWEATVTIRRSDGTPKTVSASKIWSPRVEYDKVKQSAKDDADLQRKWLAEREHGPAKAESKAVLRAFRALLQIPHTYEPARAKLPFLVVGYQFTPDTTDPLVRRLLIEKGYSAAAELYPAADESPLGGPTAADAEKAGEGTASTAPLEDAPSPATAFEGEEPSAPAAADIPDDVGSLQLPDDFGTRFPGRTLAEVAAEDLGYLEWLASEAVNDLTIREAAQAVLAKAQQSQ